MQVVIATTNRQKGAEILAILSHALRGAAIELAWLDDVAPDAAEVDETGATFAENAAIKARAATALTGRVCLADDGGLVIDALGGQPGLHSRRFLGEQTSFPDKMARILELMREVPDAGRTCRFRCAVAICTPDGRIFHCDGVCDGQIAREMRGDHGFGYDPIVFLPELGRHVAELLPDEKHRVSHRGKALACAAEILRRLST